MDTYGKVLGATTGGLGAGAIAALPNTGGSRSVITDVAILSVVVGVAILVTTAVNGLAKRYFRA